MEILESKREKREIAVFLISLGILALISYDSILPIIQEYITPESISEVVKKAGIFGPILLIAIQTAQVILAPIPPVAPVAASYAYGILEGTLYAFIGGTIGSYISITASRVYGRPLVERFVKDETMERFDDFTEGHGFTTYTVFFVLPGFPDDALCFIGGLTELNRRRLIAISSLGRLPGILALTIAGGSLSSGNTVLLVSTVILVVVISALSVEYRERIISALKTMEDEGIELLEALKQEFKYLESELEN
ncbi:MAG: TVP38/TMEM64 family protein [Candidatus Nanohaloarchaea archaeon]